MSEKINYKDVERLFREVNENDPRLASTVPVDAKIDANIKDLFTVVGSSQEKSERLDSAPYSFWRMTFTHLFKNPLVIVCLVVLGVLLFFTIFGTHIHYFEPITRNADGSVVPVTVDGHPPFGDPTNNYMPLVLNPNSLKTLSPN